MAEGTSLLRMHTAYTCIVSSNLTVSARIQSASNTDFEKTAVPVWDGGFFVCGAGFAGGAVAI